MPTLTIRNLPEDVHAKLRVRAAQNGRSTEAEVRAVLSAAVEPDITPEVRARFEAAVDAAQAAFAPYKRTGVDEVEEFLRERREEAERVEARWARLAREAEEARDRERAG